VAEKNCNGSIESGASLAEGTANAVAETSRHRSPLIWANFGIEHISEQKELRELRMAKRRTKDKFRRMANSRSYYRRRAWRKPVGTGSVRVVGGDAAGGLRGAWPPVGGEPVVLAVVEAAVGAVGGRDGRQGRRRRIFGNPDRRGTLYWQKGTTPGHVPSYSKDLSKYGQPTHRALTAMAGRRDRSTPIDRFFDDSVEAGSPPRLGRRGREERKGSNAGLGWDLIIIFLLN